MNNLCAYCSGTVYVSNPNGGGTTAGNCSNCLVLAHFYHACENIEVGTPYTIDIESSSRVSACEGDITWTLVSYDNTVFSGVSIDSAGVLSYTMDSLSNTREVIEVMAECRKADGVLLRDRTKVTICSIDMLSHTDLSLLNG